MNAEVPPPAYEVDLSQWRSAPDELLMGHYQRDPAQRMYALFVLTHRYEKPLYSYFYRRVQDEPTAVELFKQTWLMISQSPESYRVEEEAFDVWMYQCASKVLVQHQVRQEVSSLHVHNPQSSLHPDGRSHAG